MTSTSTFSNPAGPAPGREAEIQVKTGQAELDSLPVRLPPLAQAIWHGSGDAEAPAAGLAILLHPDALAQINDHSVSNLLVELGGILLGHAYRHNDKTFVEVKAAIPVVTADHGPIHFTFTADAWAQIHRDRATHYPGLDIVGWFHTHPDLGVFYSGDDVVVHSVAFVMPWHVGLVIDPVRKTAAWFGWQAGEIAPVDGFYELPAGTGESGLPWRMVRTEVWLDSYEERYGGETRPGVYTSRRPTSAALPPISGWLGLWAGGFALLLVLILFAGQVRLSNRAQALHAVASNLVGERLAAGAAAGLAYCPDPNLLILSPLAGQNLTTGSEVQVLGQATAPGWQTYRVEARPIEQETSVLLNTFRLDTPAGVLATWDTTTYPAGVYELRLTATNGQNLPLPNTTPCTIQVQLVP